MTRLWLSGLWRGRSGRLVGGIVGVALTVGLLASIGAFIASSSATMTRDAVRTVKVDWQVQLLPGADPAAVRSALDGAAPVTAALSVGYAHVPGLAAATGGTTQTTGAAVVVGVPDGYAAAFPGQLRGLVGATHGVLLAQQTAANLHAGVGDTVTVRRQGAPDATLTVDGVVGLPNADAFFQAVGAPAGSAPQAPPDNVVLLPIDRWRTLVAAQATAAPATVATQLHVALDHAGLPHAPAAAYVAVQRQARHLEAAVAGSALVGDNLAARLDGARKDALYADVLFLFLGLPGAALAAFLTLAVTASGGGRRRHEQALLRLRGASHALLLRLAAVEALALGIGGTLLGALLAEGASALWIGGSTGPARVPLGWLAVAAGAGVLLALAAVLVPAWHDARGSTVMAGRAEVGRRGTPWWQRLYLDVLLLALSGVVFWRTAATGYQLVLAPEGVASTSVHYEAFLAPVLLWLGMGLLTMRLWDGWLRRRRGAVARALRPVAGDLAALVAASVGRDRGRLIRGVILVALAFSFAVSTAVFNTTYDAQAGVDAMLTNGADVTVTGTTAQPAGARLGALRALPGVRAAQPLMHRYAYVGHDLQDMYGIDPTGITRATRLADAYFPGSSARAALATLAAHHDGVLVAEETVKDFQLQPGDRINLRLQTAADHQYHTVPFTFVGIVREFPTAPRDSFLVANASYLAAQTGSTAQEVVLLHTSAPPAAVAERAHAVVAGLPGVSVSDLGSTRFIISSSLTAVDLRGLTRLELAFAVLMLAGAAGLVLALGMAERRRTFAILSGLGADRRQLGAFLWSEALLVTLGGAVLGAITGFGVAEMLVKVLTGVFDPPPEALAVPWAYLAALALAAALATIAAVAAMRRLAARPAMEALREL